MKYYTPNIEDFHAGLRFEASIGGSWEDHLSLNGGIAYDDLVNMNLDMRVKYLDHDDLVELGWEKVGVRYFLSREKDYHLTINEEHVVEITTQIPDFTDITVFKGVVKNFNEMERVMKNNLDT